MPVGVTQQSTSQNEESRARSYDKEWNDEEYSDETC
jgi:hypothetical protein